MLVFGQGGGAGLLLRTVWENTAGVEEGGDVLDSVVRCGQQHDNADHGEEVGADHVDAALLLAVRIPAEDDAAAAGQDVWWGGHQLRLFVGVAWMRSVCAQRFSR